jgi:hypothetical protein
MSKTRAVIPSGRTDERQASCYISVPVILLMILTASSCSATPTRYVAKNATNPAKTFELSCEPGIRFSRVGEDVDLEIAKANLGLPARQAHEPVQPIGCNAGGFGGEDRTFVLAAGRYSFVLSYELAGERSEVLANSLGPVVEVNGVAGHRYMICSRTDRAAFSSTGKWSPIVLDVTSGASCP